jgi:hypothetical protein
VTFESGSRLKRIDDWAFDWSGLRSIEIPFSVALGKKSFPWQASVTVGPKILRWVDFAEARHSF